MGNKDLAIFQRRKSFRHTAEFPLSKMSLSRRIFERVVDLPRETGQSLAKNKIGFCLAR